VWFDEEGGNHDLLGLKQREDVGAKRCFSAGERTLARMALPSGRHRQPPLFPCADNGWTS